MSRRAVATGRRGARGDRPAGNARRRAANQHADTVRALSRAAAAASVSRAIPGRARRHPPEQPQHRLRRGRLRPRDPRQRAGRFEPDRTQAGGCRTRDRRDARLPEARRHADRRRRPACARVHPVRAAEQWADDSVAVQRWLGRNRRRDDRQLRYVGRLPCRCDARAQRCGPVPDLSLHRRAGSAGRHARGSAARPRRPVAAVHAAVSACALLSSRVRVFVDFLVEHLARAPAGQPAEKRAKRAGASR